MGIVLVSLTPYNARERERKRKDATLWHEKVFLLKFDSMHRARFSYINEFEWMPDRRVLFMCEAEPDPVGAAPICVRWMCVLDVCVLVGCARPRRVASLGGMVFGWYSPRDSCTERAEKPFLLASAGRRMWPANGRRPISIQFPIWMAKVRLLSTSYPIPFDQHLASHPIRSTVCDVNAGKSREPPKAFQSVRKVRFEVKLPSKVVLKSVTFSDFWT